ncbi:hypothetical protein B0920_17565 [Massilia sp. KIM]|nr:hypothetical protein B0920_17565 [Massilia sp. KIM]
MRRLIILVSLGLSATVYAGEAGKVIFVAGNAQVLDRKAVEGAPVQEGDTLQTGADGFLYVKTVDNGLFILRPNTTARIAAYHVDERNPENTRVKLELISGVARSKSGDAVKRARQNFRFNTPVAAIGVRGTDFTVFTDQTTSRVSVISGGVVVTGFSDSCRPEGSGPCEGTFSRELSAMQRGKMLQIQRGAQAPVLLNDTGAIPGQTTPAGAPVVQSGAPGQGTVTPVELTVENRKNEQLAINIGTNLPLPSGPGPSEPVTQVPDEPEQEPVPGKPDPAVPVPDVKQAGILWGRWVRLTGPAPDFNLTLERAKHQLVAVNGNFAIFRTAGQAYVTPERGSVGFALADSEAYVITNYGTTSSATAATLSNAKLNVDFGTRSFTTSFDASTRKESFSFAGQGVVGADGTLYGDRADGRANFVNVQGLLTNDKGGGASYIFDGQIDERRWINGGTTWSPIRN